MDSETVLFGLEGWGFAMTFHPGIYTTHTLDFLTGDLSETPSTVLNHERKCDKMPRLN